MTRSFAIIPTPYTSTDGGFFLEHPPGPHRVVVMDLGLSSELNVRGRGPLARNSAKLLEHRFGIDLDRTPLALDTHRLPGGRARRHERAP